jgi:hypothetical protein
VLADAMGEYDAERYIALMAREAFDYTTWQRGLWSEKGVEDLSREAMALRRQTG